PGADPAGSPADASAAAGRVPRNRRRCRAAAARERTARRASRSSSIPALPALCSLQARRRRGARMLRSQFAPGPPRLRLQSRLQQLLALADVELDGTRPWDIRMHRPRFVARVLGHGSLGLGESYMDGDWDCDALD